MDGKAESPNVQALSYFSTLDEPCKSCLEFLRRHFLGHPGVTEAWSSHTPFYHYDKKSLGFISYHPLTKEIYISFTDGRLLHHPKLRSEGRKKMKIFRVDASADIDMKSLGEIIEQAIKVKRAMKK